MGWDALHAVHCSAFVVGVLLHVSGGLLVFAYRDITLWDWVKELWLREHACAAFGVLGSLLYRLCNTFVRNYGFQVLCGDGRVARAVRYVCCKISDSISLVLGRHSVCMCADRSQRVHILKGIAHGWLAVKHAISRVRDSQIVLSVMVAAYEQTMRVRSQVR